MGRKRDTQDTENEGKDKQITKATKKKKDSNVPCTITAAPLAELHGASEFFATSLLNQDILPALIQDLFNPVRDIDNELCRNKVVVFLDVAVVELFKPEAVRGLAVLIHAVNFRAMPDLTFPAQGGQRADVGMHGSKHQSGIGRLAANILGSVVPVDTHRVYRA